VESSHMQQTPKRPAPKRREDSLTEASPASTTRAAGLLLKTSSAKYYQPRLPYSFLTNTQRDADSATEQRPYIFGFDPVNIRNLPDTNWLSANNDRPKEDHAPRYS
jgi:hypothetical protein